MCNMITTLTCFFFENIRWRAIFADTSRNAIKTHENENNAVSEMERTNNCVRVNRLN